MKSENPKYKWFVLYVLTAVYMFNFVDRQVMIILQEEIKKDLLLSDTQLGLLTGLAFAILYTTLGIPIAKFADTRNRKNILSFSLAFWSGMTVLSGTAQNFFQMMLTRIGVSAGEAGGMPPSHSIISDYFPEKERGIAFSIYTMGVYLGVLLGFIVAGMIASNYGWRTAFYVLGFPGIIFALFVYFVIKEPIRGRMDANYKTIKDPTFSEVIQTLFAKKSFLNMCLGAGFTTFTFYSVNNFLPSYLQRVHEIDLVTVSIVLGLSTAIGGISGALLGGRIADGRGATNKKWYLYVPIIACLSCLIPALILFYTPIPKLALAMVLPYAFLSSMFNGPIYAVAQSLANAKMRAFASAILLLFLNGIGLAFGPVVAGMVSDYLAPTYGNLSLRYAISLNLLSLFLAIWFYWKAAGSYEEDLGRMK